MESTLPGMPKRPALPPPGKLLISRIPTTDILKITWPDGQNRTVVYDKTGPIKLARLGIDQDRQEKLINYIYNFYHAYAASSVTAPPAPVAG